MNILIFPILWRMAHLIQLTNKLFFVLLFFTQTMTETATDHQQATDSIVCDINNHSSLTTTSLLPYEQDGIEAKEIAQYIYFYPFKGIDKFYDISDFLYTPDIFQKIIHIFAKRYESIGIDIIVGLDARGFVLGPPIALQLQKPFVMIRKEGKLPNTISSNSYETEYGTRSGLTIQRNRIHKGQRVLIIDDLVATGGTLASSITLIHQLGGIVVECACVVELKMFINPTESSGIPSRTKLFQTYGIEHVPVWGLISEDLLVNNPAPLPENYKDDGEEH